MSGISFSDDLVRDLVGDEQDTWEARCHWCKGPSFAWLTDDETWAKVEPLLGQQQACFECFAAAWWSLGYGGVFRVAPG